VMAREATQRSQKRKVEALALLLPLRKPLKPLHPAVATWQAQYATPRERYKLLVLHGRSGTGKTALAKALFGAERTLVIDAQAAAVPPMKDYRVGEHDCVVFDEMGAGASLIVGNKKLMQAHSDGARVSCVSSCAHPGASRIPF
jgi:hypothetical protein